MITNSKNLQKIFLFCLGIFIGTAFCMKWMEADFIYHGEKFTIIGLELSYSKDRVTAILSGIDAPVKQILRYHLSFDYLFMIGVYPGIAALCLMARNRTSNQQLQKILCVVATLQLMAWACDILENYCLLKWISKPIIGNEFMLYHFIVIIKWLIALGGAILAIVKLLRNIMIIQKKENKPV